jgi:aryl-alcohol dehydrogenase-like predicted oxidoreductase
LLTGKYSRSGGGEGRLVDNFLGLGGAFLNERNLQLVDALEAFCRERGRTLLELAVSWLASRPVISSVICGATRPEQVEQNVRAADWALSADDLAQIDKITQV